jgi:thymidylate kinase
MIQGKLIVFEGPDSVGKTTLARTLVARFDGFRIPCDYVSFPGKGMGTLGRLVYDIHHDMMQFGINSINSTSLQLLHIAAHIDAIGRVIVPALKNGRIVVLDRYWWSTFVYGMVSQANRQSLEQMIALEKNHWGEIRPHVVFLLRRARAGSADLRLPQLIAEYEKLAQCESAFTNVVPLEVHSDVEITMLEIIQSLKDILERGQTQSDVSIDLPL